MSDVLLDVQDVTTVFDTARGPLRAVNGVSFTLRQGETLGIVLYDVASPDPLESLMRLGAPVSVSSDPCGSTTIRAHYLHGIRGSAG